MIHMTAMQQRAYALMKRWCDTLLTYQVHSHTPYTNDALLCPACHVIHGRIADLCFPLTVIYAQTGDESYLQQADRLIEWSEYNLRTEDGIWYNDVGNRWFAISAFSALSIGDALDHFGDRLPRAYRDKWMALFTRMAETIYGWDRRTDFHPVSNYYCGTAAVLALAAHLTGETRYREKAGEWIERVLARFDQDGLLYGEGYPMVADDGTHTVDAGYNLEESLALLLRYAELTGEHRDTFRNRLRDHLAFLLPDGAIDNTFGTRHNKWTYWGSRTSDGVIEALATAMDVPLFAEACERVLALYERCTVDGLLALPMAQEAGEPTCLHHTFTHAKALAALVCAANVPDAAPGVPLPCECPYGVRSFQNGKLLLVATGGFRATFSAIHAHLLPEHAANGGGSLNLLYHRACGVICAATTAEYIPSEPLNQQLLRHRTTPPCLTAQFIVDGQMGCREQEVSLQAEGTCITVTAPRWQVTYAIGEDVAELRLCCEDGVYQLPIVSSYTDRVDLSADGRCLTVGDRLTLSSDAPLCVDPQERIFHPVGGLQYLPVSVAVRGTVQLSLRVTV